ncbi:uncharacterized protein SPAPADRAFT_52215 [Spathaspora passalidarum NRRL Y-27907]|uniref:Alpha-1,3-mannosyltransferase n=1 Tax=Spathaspora passalidarum (strain NRRL Y-27907 / 11-Y1) TaxID=619300 RepID=G3AS73_SPAPN|nr:uncharacterized protein SPAPADRAFT_52215 [Spathaspora passalidarum NRRL Y-27907]EGW31032.1 hypothetical protein SPAPADRAFT_52215 [Spathaspora passalidarum NRRL Y-27907]
MAYEELESIYLKSHDADDADSTQLSIDSALIETNNLVEEPAIQLLQQEMIEMDTREVDLHASIYDQIFANHEMESVFANLDFDQRCQLYFNNLYVKNNNWFLDPHQQMKPDHKSAQFREYRQKNYENFKAEFDRKKDKPKEPNQYDKKLEDFIKDKFNGFKSEEDDEFPQKLVEYFTTVRVFNKCFVTNEDPDQISKVNSFIDYQRQILDRESDRYPFEHTDPEKLSVAKHIEPSAFEHRVYPWMTFEYPVYEHWTGAMVHEPPDAQSLNPQAYKSKSTSKSSSNFIKQFKNRLNGRGIVLTLPDHHTHGVVSMIRLLRALKNRLPIQIVNFEDLALENKKQIVAAARDDIETLPMSYQKVAEYLGDDYFNHNEGGLPKQEVWFVSVHNAINKNYRDKFTRFGNKFLAAFFNSFEEFMLVDDDAAMLKSPEFFFNLKSYQEKGAVMYRDRTTGSSGKRTFFKKLGPSLVDAAMFDIPIITEYTLDREFFKGTTYYIEAGLVMMNRKLHFDSILVTLQTYFFDQIRKKVYGDKELFWLGMALNGDEKYHINGMAAAAAGVITDPKDRLRKNGEEHYSLELCSAHPAHISDEDEHTLLWINSGLSVCHHSSGVDYEMESKVGTKFKFVPQTVEAFKEFFTSPLIIKHAIIAAYDGGWHHNIEDEPSRGWQSTKYCHKYMWCSFSSIGGKKKDGSSNYLEGKVITFEEHETALFKYYADTYLALE